MKKLLYLIECPYLEEMQREHDVCTWDDSDSCGATVYFFEDLIAQWKCGS